MCADITNPGPSIAANIAMSQVNFPTHIMMWPHRLVDAQLQWPVSRL